jgi:large subunit ribosomal protein L22
METQEKNKTNVEKNADTPATVRGNDMKVSLKHSMAICNFIKGKTIDYALKDLEEVMKMKKAIPMRGEIPHRKGNITGGRYPIKTAYVFIKLLKSLEANANNKGLDTKTIRLFAKADKASRPRKSGKYGGRKFKRTHILISAK